jgi:iron complex transport system substrate-binding protein
MVSLTAAITETLFALQLEDRVVGVTDTCDYPKAVFEKPNVGCWFEPDLAKLIALEPDLVVGLETAHLGLKDRLEKRGIRVILINPSSVKETLDVFTKFGKWFEVAKEAEALVKRLQDRLAKLDNRVRRIPYRERLTVCRVLDLEGDQLIVAGPLSFQYDVISQGGGRNVTGALPDAYPKITFSQLQKWNPAMIFFCGYDRHFIRRLLNDFKWRSLQAIQSHRVYQFDCALTCRTGPRIVDMAELLYKTLYAEKA